MITLNNDNIKHNCDVLTQGREEYGGNMSKPGNSGLHHFYNRAHLGYNRRLGWALWEHNQSPNQIWWEHTLTRLSLLESPVQTCGTCVHTGSRHVARVHKWLFILGVVYIACNILMTCLSSCLLFTNLRLEINHVRSYNDCAFIHVLGVLQTITIAIVASLISVIISVL